MIPVLRTQWRQRVDRWQASGLSVRAFCRREGLTEPTFHFWKRELRARDETTAASPRPAANSPGASPKFVPLTVLPAATVAVEVRCPSGHVVCLSSCEVSALASLFAALTPPASEEPSC